jgi:hypothetical protein
VRHGARMSVDCRLTRRADGRTVRWPIKTFLTGGVLRSPCSALRPGLYWKSGAASSFSPFATILSESSGDA